MREQIVRRVVTNVCRAMASIRSRGVNARRAGNAVLDATVKLTSTEVDRAYAAELEREGALERPAQAIPRTQQKPVRQQARHEGDDLPLYGKIDL